MRWVLPVVLASGLIPGIAPNGYGQEPADLQHVFIGLQNPETSDKAAAQLRSAAKDHPAVRQFLADNLPQLIRNSGPGPVRLNAVRLAGDFKIQEAVPALLEELGDEHTTGGTVTMAEALRLDNDPPGKALAQIGDPSIPAVEALLESSVRSTRFRAVYVLWNIGSVRAKEALRGQLDRESDPAIRHFIQKALSAQ